MEIINGKYASAKIFSNSVEKYAITQIENICNNEVAKNAKVRVMSDVHPGLICPIGFTMTLENLENDKTGRILPNLVSVDIGCGVTIAKITKSRGIEFKKLDSVIRNCVPSGFNIRKNPHRFSFDLEFSKLKCQKHIFKEKAVLSLGTLGGGNHFIEIDKSRDNEIFITVHTGSRHLGKEITDFYLNEGRKILREKACEKGFENSIEIPPDELTYLEGNLMKDYLEDMKFAQNFAELNRLAIIDEIAKGMKWKIDESYSCAHNYIDFGEEQSKCDDIKNTNGTFSSVPILRKGAISSQKGERVIIPVNMRDGVILGVGKGNEDWNFSAPHGSGRIMKREDVKKSFTVNAFKKWMEGIYSSCIEKGTLDEAPFAYRRIDEIAKAIEPTVEVTKILKPIYNFKAASED